MDMLEKKIRDANARGRIAIIPFLTAGFPDRKKFWESLHELDDAGVDIMEIGVPFSDPVADGPVIEEASRRVLHDGVTLAALLEKLRDHKFKSGIVLMGYMNPFFQYGLEKLAKDARAAGVHGLIVPDLPFEESAPVKAILNREGITLIPLVGPNTSRERMALYAKDARGYVYVVSVMGITGERKNLAAGISQIIAMAKEIFSVPVALGFGLKHPGQLEELDVKPDAAVFGSALLLHIDAGKPARDFVLPWLENN